MKKEDKNIFPVFKELLQREDKEILLKQRSKVLWMTGLSGSGKTSIANGLERKLYEEGFLTQILDGDNIRTGISSNLSFSEEDRLENNRRVAEVSKLFLNAGIVTINCFVSPTIEIREKAKEIIGEKNFLEIFINTPLEVCERRDPKGLYKKARKGEIKDFTGINAPFEPPVNPDFELMTAEQTLDESIKHLFDFIVPIIKFDKE